MRWTVWTIALVAALILWLLGTFADAASLPIAKRYIGITEGSKAAYALTGVNTRRVPWCGYFAAAVTRKAGRKPPAGYAAARSWRSYGRAVSIASARPGDIVVLKPGKRYHVTIFSRRSNGRVCGIGGNQSNRVKESCYRASSVVAVRR